MEQLQKASIVATYSDGSLDVMDVQFNPTEFSLDKGAQLAEIDIPGLDSPLLQFVRGQNEKLTVDLFFDTTETGTGAGATSVTTLTDRLYSLVKIEPAGHAPPICTFIWNASFPGADLPASAGNQRRNHFQCVVESIKQKFTFFSPEGVPLRATLGAVAARVQDARPATRSAQPDVAEPHAQPRDAAGRHAGRDRRPLLPASR